MISSEMFEKPSGDVLGVVTGTVVLGKKSRRVAHAFILQGSQEPQVSLEVPKAKLAPADVSALAKVLTEFTAELERLRGRR